MTLTARALTWQAGGVMIVDGLDVTAAPGHLLGVLGPNGSGKSTLLRLLAGILKPSAGAVTLDDEDVHQLPSRARAQRIAFVEQEAATDLDLQVRDVVALGRIPYRRWLSSDADEGPVEQAMATCDVTHLATRSWQTLSGGERQRVHLARALAQQPQVLLLDEPTNHLDLRHQIDFLERARRLGLTTVAALHDLEMAAAFCDDLLVLDRGRVVRHGPTEGVLQPRLLAQVFEVDADVEPHPKAARPHVRWNGTL